MWPDSRLVRRCLRTLFAAAALGCGAGAQAQEFKEFSSEGLPGSHGLVVRVSHPGDWSKVAVEDEMALAELRGPLGSLTGILQIGRGRVRTDMEAICKPERARAMLRNAHAQEPGTRVMDVVARRHEGRPAFEIRYERSDAGEFMRVRSLVVCLKDTRLVVSCGGSGAAKPALGAMEPVCQRVLESLAITEE